jgi:HK97 family phage major capsid protein
LKLSDLKARRAKLLAEAREIEVSNESDLPAEAEKRSAEIMSEVEALESRIARVEKLEEAERRMQGQPVTGTGDDRLDAELRNFSLVRAIASQVPGLNVDAGRERELSAEIARRAGRPFQGMAVPLSVFHRPVEQRVITSTLPTAGAGGNLIATDHLGGQYIDALRAKLVIRRLGARILSGLVGNVDIPKLATSASAGWVAENAAITPSEAEFDKVELTPKHVGCLTEFSRNMLLQSSPDIEQLIRNDFAAVLARAVDAAAINGAGGTAPTGILNNADIDATTSMATPSWASVLTLISLVEEADGEGMAFLTRPSAVKTLRSTARNVESGDNSERFIMESPTELAGYPLVSTTLVPNDIGSSDDTALIFGNFSDVLLGYWSEFDLLVNPFESTAYSKGNVQIRGMITCDVQLRHGESFAAATDFPAP